MKMRMMFEKDGEAELVITAEGEFEKRLLGVIANGQDRVVDALVECEARAHASYGTIDEATIRLKRRAPLK